MLKINFNLKSPNSEKSLIIARGSLYGDRMVISTGITIPVVYWNQHGQCVRKTAEFKEGNDIQDKLNSFRSRIITAEKKYRDINGPKSIYSFKQYLKQLDNTEIKNFSLNDFIDDFITRRSKSNQFSKGSIKVYNTFRNHFKKYVRNRRLNFSDINVDLIIGFLEWLRKKGYSDNHVQKIYSSFKVMLNEANEQGYIEKSSFNSKRIKVSKRDADNIYLNEDEIEAIYKLKLDEESKSISRDLFIIGCYTGLRYSDFSHLTRKNIVVLPNGKKAFRIIVFKTNDIVWIPIHPIVQEILEKHDYQLPTGFTNQVMNRHLKEIANEAGIRSIYQKRIFRSNRAHVIEQPKYAFTCTHTARRSFASNAYKAGVPILSIMKITGHKKTETFQKYINLSNEEHAELMSENHFFK